MKTEIINSNRSLAETCGKLKRDFEKYKFLSIKVDHQKRSIISNSLQFHWYTELQQQGDNTAPQYRNYCKYHFGCPLRAAQDEYFAKTLRDIFMRYTYEERIDMMSFIDVTSTFDRPTMSEYLFAIKMHYGPLGFVLTNAEDVKRQKISS
jgi:hypothetical protein